MGSVEKTVNWRTGPAHENFETAGLNWRSGPDLQRHLLCWQHVRRQLPCRPRWQHALAAFVGSMLRLHAMMMMQLLCICCHGTSAQQKSDGLLKYAFDPVEKSWDWVLTFVVVLKVGFCVFWQRKNFENCVLFFSKISLSIII